MPTLIDEGSISCNSAAESLLGTVCRIKRVIWIAVSIVFLAGYTVMFSQWWHKSPRYTKLVAGKPVEYLEFHYNSFSWRTRVIWIPALWCAKSMGGYHELGFAAAYEHSMVLYAR